MRIEKPVLVGVRGYVVGGGFGRMLAGDMVIASQTTRFMASWMRLGIMPDGLTLYTLPRLIRLAKARKLFIADEALSAKEALALALVTEVIPDEELDARGLTIAQSPADGPAEVWGLTNMVLARTFETGIDDMFLLEGLGQVLAMGAPEFDERVQTLLDKRPQKPSTGDLLREFRLKQQELD
jgi:2-(1,2-epoxy-1,2-dihydrophenyl)acetyl-CoA isomerase